MMGFDVLLHLLHCLEHVLDCKTIGMMACPSSCSPKDVLGNANTSKPIIMCVEATTQGLHVSCGVLVPFWAHFGRVFKNLCPELALFQEFVGTTGRQNTLPWLQKGLTTYV